MSIYLWLSLFSFLGCEATKDKSPTKGETPSLIEKEKDSSSTKETPTPQKEVSNALPEDKVAFYRKDFPEAARFQKRDIPADFLAEIDKSNSTYYDVLDAKGTIIGHLRDFMGPVTSEENCACNPLSLTLTYNTDYRLRNIISVAPLQKYGHEALTEEEHQQMVDIAKNPSPELSALQAPQDMIDGSTGATSATYKGKVVDKAGYSSWRISRLAVETAQILQGAPIQRDADRLQKMLQGAQNPSDQRAKIIAFLPTAESDYLKQRAIFILAELYLQGLMTGEKTDGKTEETILNAGLGEVQEAELLINLCLAFVEQKVAPTFVSSCIKKLENNAQKSMFESQIALLKGLELVGQDKGKEAIPYLEKGLSSGSPAPELRQKMATVYTELKESKKACVQLEGIYAEAPLWPNLDDMLASCGDTNKIKARLDKKRKADLIASAIPAPKRASTMMLLDESSQKKAIDFSKGNKKRVVVFFATWCPHCQKEMPRLVDFYNQLQLSDLKDRVELVPIRASIARETQSFADFKRQYNIPFTIMTDEGIAFESFANEQGVSPGFPMIAITNTKGEVVYFLSHGDHNDTAKELFWVLRSL